MPAKTHVKDGKRSCNKCRQILPIENFSLRSKSKYKRGKCKECCRQYANQRRDSAIASRQAAVTRRRLYGISDQDYACLVELQKGRCAICEQARKLGVDHCHSTGKVRQLLCQNCNTLLGQAFDDPRILEKAIQYLSLHSIRAAAQESIIHHDFRAVA